MAKESNPIPLEVLERSGWKLKRPDPYVSFLKLLEVVREIAEDKEAEWEFEIQRDKLTGFMRKVTAKKVSKSSSGSAKSAPKESLLLKE